MKPTHLIAGALASALLALPAAAQTTVKAPWVRGTVAQQKATGAFMRLTARTLPHTNFAILKLQGRFHLEIAVDGAADVQVSEIAWSGSE